MNYKKIILITVASVAIVALVILGVYMQKNKQQPVITEQTATTTFANMKPLPLVDEMALQKQLQEILAKGKDADCVNLNDARYQFACHDLFKNMKK